MRSQRWSGALTVVVAVIIVAALSLLTVTVISGFGDDDGTETATVDLDGDVAADRTTTTRPRATTTTTRPPATTEVPEVLGDVTEREPTTTTTTAPTPTVTTAPPTPTTTVAPTTTTTICRNSTDPACGPLMWDPEPGPYDVEVYALEVPATAVVGEPVTLAVEYVEPASGTAMGACAFWMVEDPGVVNTSSCEEVAHACDRYGPHDPPLPSRDRVPVQRQVTFTTTGEHTVTVSGHTATHLPDGCGNPYLNGFERTYTIVVTET